MAEEATADQNPPSGLGGRELEDHEPGLGDSTSQKRAAIDDLESGEATDQSEKAESSPPPCKRAKLGPSDAESASDEVDEGEIIETSSSSGDELDRAEADKDSDTGEDPGSPISELPQTSQGWNKGVSSGLRTSFGPSPSLGLPKVKQTGKITTPSGYQGARPTPTQIQTTESHKSATNPSNEALANPDSPTNSPADNTGDMNASEPPAQSKAERARNASFSLEERQKMEIAIQALAHKDLAAFVRDKHPWVLPVMNSNFRIGAPRHLNWCLKFEEWCKEFLSANKQYLRSSPAKIERYVWDAYQHYTENLPTLSKPKRRSIKAAATEVRQQGKVRDLVITALGEPQVSTQNAAKAPVSPKDPPPPAEDEVSEPNGRFEAATAVGSKDIEVTESRNEIMENLSNTQQERTLISRYYPGIPDNVDFCLTCASLGHHAEACPSKTCRFCQGAHFFYECPLRRRCEKCQQLGHTISTCKEKLALAPGEEGFIECAFCQGADHYEDKCIEIWRTYHPDPHNVHKVNKLPVFCHSCGQEGHYGGDCGIQLVRWDNNPKETWTKRSLNLYLDTESSAVAVVYENGLPLAHLPPGRPDIPGRSIVPQTHIFFDDSDDEADNNFIKAPVQKQQAPGQIRIASNIDFSWGQPSNPPQYQPDDLNTVTSRTGNNNADSTQRNNGRRRRGARAQRDAQAMTNPPLPPGPPPAAAPAHALPPRPAGQQNNNPNGNTSRRARQRQRTTNHHQQQQASNYDGQGNGRQQGLGQQGPPRGGGGSNRGRGGFSSALGGGNRPRRGRA